MSMLKKITAKEMRVRLGEVMDQVRLKGDRFIVERNGRPMAAVVPLEINEAYERDREYFFQLIRTIQQKNAKVTLKQVEKDVAKAVAEVRGKV